MISLITALWLTFTPAMAQEEDPIALATVLVADGHMDRALTVLEEIDTAKMEKKGEDMSRFYLLRGLARHSAEQLEGARDDLRDALNLGANEAIAWLTLARAEESLDESESAWNTLRRGYAQWPADARFLREEALLMLRLGLFQASTEVAQEYLKLASNDELAWLTVGEALRGAGALDESIVVLEEARVRFPRDERIAKLLAGVWLQAEEPLAAGSVLSEAAYFHPELAEQASECYRRGGAHVEALRQNGRVPESPAKTRQRLGLLIEMKSWDRIVALYPRIRRLGLLDDDAVAYGLGYAFYQAGDLERAEEALQTIDTPRWFEDAARLRSAMSSCEEWGCR